MFNVAIVTPIYNTQDYLHRCIQSVLGQQGVSLQYFLIDDGSTDNSPTIAQYYQRKDSRVTFIRKCNEGQGVARNIGIKLADAEYIYFVDSDDYLGEDALSILYNTAKANNLDICSPSVPKHYFDKPLEYIPCLPCKSQFIRLGLIRDFKIFQPSIQSGQDGVFSHLVLAHCNRVGMAEQATFHYTHAREGSTFTTHLKRHDLVPSLLEQHYAAIESHYDKHDLWKRNAIRLHGFISDESLRNRVEPHLPNMSDDQKIQCFGVLSRIAKKAHKYLTSADISRVHPAVTQLISTDVARLAQVYNSQFLGKKFENRYPSSSNLHKDGLIICKYANTQMAPPSKGVDSRSIQPEQISDGSVNRLSSEKALGIQGLRSELKVLRGKLDLAINSINNSSIKIVSEIHLPACNLSKGNPEIVVSLTTLPHRLPLVHFAIESIYAQTMLPARIVLWVTDRINANNVLTPQLEALMTRGLEIRRVKDVGPHTKLIYALKEFSDKNIITVDDDIVYPMNMISCLWEQHVRFPGAVTANWARELAFDSAGKVQGVRSGKLLTPPILESEIEQANHYKPTPNLLGFPYGTGGVLYPPGALNSQVFDISVFTSLCPKEDDIWFKAMGLLNQTPVVATNLGINPSHHCITGSQSEALRHDNHGLAQNEKQMRAIFESLNLYKIVASGK